MLTRRTPAAHARRARGSSARSAATGSSCRFGVGVETVVFPGFDGGAEWGGPAFDPATGLLYVNANEMAWTGHARARRHAARAAGALPARVRRLPSRRSDGAPPQIPSLVGIGAPQGAERDHADRPPGHRPDARAAGAVDRRRSAPSSPSSAPARAATSRTRRPTHRRPARTASPATGSFLDPDGYPAIAPPWGTLTAIDLNTGEQAWQVPLGEYPELAAQGHREHRHRELRRPDRHGRRAGVHRRDQLRQEGARLRQGHRRAAVGGARCRSRPPGRPRPTRSTAASSWSCRPGAGRPAARSRRAASTWRSPCPSVREGRQRVRAGVLGAPVRPRLDG